MCGPTLAESIVRCVFGVLLARRISDLFDRFRLCCLIFCTSKWPLMSAIPSVGVGVEGSLKLGGFSLRIAHDFSHVTHDTPKSMISPTSVALRFTSRAFGLADAFHCQ